jgi:hypothetical protein
MIEVWRPIPSAPGYDASSLGRIRSLTRQVPIGPQGMTRWVDGRVLEPSRPSGRRMHLKVNLGRGRDAYVHDLVCEAFKFQPKPPGAVVLHLDDDPMNNCPLNLEYGSYAENNQAIVEARHRAADEYAESSPF